MQDIRSEILHHLRRNDLLRAVVSLSKVGDPTFKGSNEVERIMALALRVWNRCASRRDPVAKAQAINEVLFKDCGIKGSHERYKNIIDDPNRFYLHQLLKNRAGSPLLISTLYLILCEQIGLSVECIALSSHYLIRLKEGGMEFYIDPFDQGKLLSSEDFHRKFRIGFQKRQMIQASLYETLTHRHLVARLAQQLKQIYILKGKSFQALRAVEVLKGFYPESPELIRDRGILYCEMEYFSKAAEDLKAYLKLRPDAEDVREIKKLTTMIKGYREIVN